MARHRAITRLVLTVAVILGWSPPAHAYLDPGTGSMLLQLLLGGLAGLLVLLKLYWHRLKRRFHERFRRAPSSPATLCEDVRDRQP